MEWNKGALLYEGKAKKVYESDDQRYVIVEYKDDATAFNGEKKGQIKDKRRVNNLISAKMFGILEERGIPTHYVKTLKDHEMVVKHCDIIPVEVIVRNVAAGGMAKKLGIDEGGDLIPPVVEYCLKSDSLSDPMINDDHIRALGLATEEEMEIIRSLSLRINEVLKEVYLKAGLGLVDFKLEFGRHEGEIILGDEISPDTCRLWDIKTGESMDKDRFRRDLGYVEEAYQEVLKRISAL